MKSKSTTVVIDGLSKSNTLIMLLENLACLGKKYVKDIRILNDGEVLQ
jgi:hypothetical protein